MDYSDNNFWKLDKIDKFFVCLILILICLFEFCNTFVFADEVVSPSFVDNCFINSSLVLQYGSDDSSDLLYFQIDDNYLYNFSFVNSGDYVLRFGFIDSFEANINVNSVVTLNPGTSLDFTVDGSTVNYLYLCASEFDYSFEQLTSFVSCSRNYLPSYDNAISNLVGQVGINNLWSIFDVSVPFIFVVVVVAIGVFLIISFIKKGSKGKSGF